MLEISYDPKDTKRILDKLWELYGYGNSEPIKQYNFPLVHVVCDGVNDAWFQCHFCGEIGLFPSGNGGIPHTNECAITLIKRLRYKKEYADFFDQLAIQSVYYQVAHIERYPKSNLTNVKICPFCKGSEKSFVRKGFEKLGGVWYIGYCIVVLAWSYEKEEHP